MADGMKISRFRQYNVDFDRQIANWLAEQFCGVCVCVFFFGWILYFMHYEFFFLLKKSCNKILYYFS